MESITFFKILMIHKELSNKEIAKKIGISEVSVKEWIDGNKNIPFSWLDKLKKVLEIENPELLTQKMKLPTIEEMGLIGDKLLEDIQIEKTKPQMIWQPVGTELINFHRSVLTEKNPSPPVSINKHKSTFINYDIENNETDKVSVWGVKDGNNFMTFNKFHRIKNGDIVMFYSSQKFIAYGEVIGKLIDEELSVELWLSNEFKNIYVLKNVQVLKEDFTEWTKIIYGKASRSLQSLRILDDNKTEIALELLRKSNKKVH